MSVELPKTEASEAPGPVIAPQRKILAAWTTKTTIIDDCWIFQAGFTRKDNHPETLLDAAKLTPLSPQNVLRDVIAPALESWRRQGLSGTGSMLFVGDWRRISVRWLLMT